MLRYGIITAVLGVALVGCEGTKLEEASKVSPNTDEHGEALYTGYLQLSETEYNEGDYRDSDFFAVRAERAANNEKFEPQEIGARDLPAKDLNDAATARRRLVVVLYQGAAQSYPRDAAQAQLGFDCWMQEQEEGFQTDDIASCRQRYETAMGRIEAAMAAKPIERAAPTSNYRLVFEVFFDFDSNELTEPAKNHIAAIADITKAYEKPVVAVIGNADQSGSENYNVELSQRRADIVAKELEKHGVIPDAVIGRGDQVPDVDQADKGSQRLNRRTIINVREAEAN